MRILILAPRLPWPPTDGGRVAMSRLTESLARAGGEVEVLALNPRKHRVAALRAPVPAVAVDIDTSRRLGPAVRSLLSPVPFIVARFVSSTFERELRDALKRFDPDVVQIESPFLLPYVDFVRATSRARVVLRSLNVEFRIWEGLANVERKFIRRVAMRRVAASLRSYELRAMKEVDAVVPISDADAADFRRLGITKPMHVVPCGVTVAPPAEPDGEPGTVGFIGSLDFLPNQNAVRWILDDLWPRVAAAEPAAKLVIGGSNPPQWLRDRVVDLRANVADAAEFLRSVRVVLAPVFAGGGMRIKALEAMALGKAVVATTLGAGGVEAVHGRDIMIADDAESFASAVVHLLRDPEAAARLGAAARETVQRRYDNDALARGLLAFYASL